MRIALIGHSCSPILGSEPGVTWNWAASLDRTHDVTLLAHPIYKAHVDKELEQRPRQNLRIEWVVVPPEIDPWKDYEKEAGVRRHYRLWQVAAGEALARLHAQEPFELVHQVSWASLQQPSIAWKLGIPFVWGPVGGGQVWPAAFMRYAGRTAKIERVRRLMIQFTRFNWPVVRAVRKADLLLTTNRETARVVNQIGPKRTTYFADYGIKESWLEASSQRDETAGNLHMLWGGRCEPRKGLPLVLEAMARAQHPGIRLTAAGTGPCLDEWKKLAADLGIADRVQFLGQVAWTQMGSLFTKCDALVFPSLRDSQGTIVLEAMAHGMPIIALDHQGVASVVPADAGIKVAVTTPDETIGGLARAMGELADDPNRRREMGCRAARCAAENTWQKRAEQMTALYQEVLLAHRGV